MSTLLSINNYHYRRGGAEVVFLEQNRLFDGIGWQVIPFCMQHEKNLPTEWSRFFVNEIEFGQNYSFLQKTQNAAKITYSFEAKKKLSLLLNQVKPDIAHAHNIYHHISPSFFSLLKAREIPTVLTLHDLKIACPAYKMLTHDGICERCKGGAIWNVIKHRCIKNSVTLSSVIFFESLIQRLLGCYSQQVDRLVVPSKFYKDKLVEWGWPAEKIVHIPNFIDITAHKPNYNIGKAFIYFGRLGEEKGLYTLVKAAAKAKVPLWIVGTGSEEAALHKLAKKTGADVQFFGYQTGSTLHELIRDSRALVLPSEWYENAPMSILESYALGRPVLGANIGGIPELIRPRITGDLFESANIDSLSNAMQSFTKLPDNEIASMGRAGRNWVEQEFTAQRYQERLLNLYKILGAKL